MTDLALSFLRPPSPEQLLRHVDEQLAAGLPRLGAHAGLGGPMRRILVRQALDLCLAGKGPDGAVRHASIFVEAELAPLTRAGRQRRLSGEQGELFQKLQTLLPHQDALAEQAGWVVRDRFADPTLPVYLLGLEIARGHPQAGQLRRQLVCHRGWALAAWVAVLLGDPLHHWLALLQDEQDPLWAIERTLIAGYALGAAPEGTTAEERFRAAFCKGVAALVWLAPAWRDHSLVPERGLLEEDSPLYLDVETWNRLLQCHARASRLLGAALPPLEQLWRSPEAPLGRIFGALDLPRRLNEDQALAVCVQCAPLAGALQGKMDERFWVTGYPDPAEDPRLWSYFVNQQRDPAWLHDLAVPALWQADPEAAVVALGACSAEQRGRPANRLIHDPLLIADWIHAFRRLLDSRSAAEAATAWAYAVGHSTAWSGVGEDFLLDEAPELLRAQGLWPQAADSLRRSARQSQLLQGLTGDDAIRSRRIERILRLIELPLAEVEALIEKMQHSLSVGPLLAYGVSPAFLFGQWMRWYGRARDPMHRGLMQDAKPELLTLLTRAPAAVLPLLGAELQQEPTLTYGHPPVLHALLNQLEAGAWLEELIAWRPDPAAPRTRILTRLATRSLVEEVRRRCLKELLA